jgi:hypothetical protein
VNSASSQESDSRVRHRNVNMNGLALQTVPNLMAPMEVVH